ncbi:MAG: hypothetical protein KDB80_07790, partial [Planctomycetes bacterium]|nr:hypothetical protein [Planctomycetota bacterium]
MLANYAVALTVELTPHSVPRLAALSAAEQQRVADHIDTVLFDPLGAPPTGAPWTGTIPIDGATSSIVFADVYAVMNTVVADWNSKYTLQFQTGSAGTDPTSRPLNNTLKWVYINGEWIRVPNASMFLAPNATSPYDPLVNLRDNP